MQKYAKICTAVAPSLRALGMSPVHLYAKNTQKYAKICKICKHEGHVQICKNMHSPLYWWRLAEVWTGHAIWRGFRALVDLKQGPATTCSIHWWPWWRKASAFTGFEGSNDLYEQYEAAPVNYVAIWNLGTHDFRCDFTIFFIYMNSCMNSDMNSWSCHWWCQWRISWNQVRIHVWNHLWIHDNEIIYEFIIMNSWVNSVLWRISWSHVWIPGNEFTYEIMVEFIILKLFQIQLPEIMYFSAYNFLKSRIWVHMISHVKSWKSTQR